MENCTFCCAASFSTDFYENFHNQTAAQMLLKRMHGKNNVVQMLCSISGIKDMV